MLPPDIETPYPPHLEDEALLIEHGGEMPEVALAESLHYAGQPSPEDLDWLRLAAVKGYLHNIHRDLNPANLGAPDYRGLDRALANFQRLRSFMAGLGWELPASTLRGLGQALVVYLRAERAALQEGRAYATSDRRTVGGLCQALGVEPGPWQDLLERLDSLPLLDFWGLRALARLEGVSGAAKRQRYHGQDISLEVLDGQGRVKAAASLPWLGPKQNPDPENRARAELVWSLLEPPEID